MTNLFLERSQSTAIYVHLYEPKPPNELSTSEHEIARVADVLTPFMHRTSAFDIESYSPSQNLMSTVLSMWLEHVDASIPGSLKISRPIAGRILSLNGVSGSGELNNQSEHARSVLRSLRVLHLDKVQFDWGDGAYRSLHDLRLDFSGCRICISALDLVEVLSANPMLTILKLRGIKITIVSKTHSGSGVSGFGGLDPALRGSPGRLGALRST
ncbi:hypothetical protein FRC12_018647 [Ceratobasidium sp. 428]|nr:hypothetical protein FRC12_018647 [Ceratobasidium sp. 428]